MGRQKGSTFRKTKIRNNENRLRLNGIKKVNTYKVWFFWLIFLCGFRFGVGWRWSIFFFTNIFISLLFSIHNKKTTNYVIARGRQRSRERCERIYKSVRLAGIWHPKGPFYPFVWMVAGIGRRRWLSWRPPAREWTRRWKRMRWRLLLGIYID